MIHIFFFLYIFYQQIGAQVPQNSTVPQHKAEATSENNAASKHSNDYAVSMRGNKECSEKGSEAQVSIFN